MASSISLTHSQVNLQAKVCRQWQSTHCTGKENVRGGDSVEPEKPNCIIVRPCPEMQTTITTRSMKMDRKIILQHNFYTPSISFCCSQFDVMAMRRIWWALSGFSLPGADDQEKNNSHTLWIEWRALIEFSSSCCCSSSGNLIRYGGGMWGGGRLEGDGEQIKKVMSKKLWCTKPPRRMDKE